MSVSNTIVGISHNTVGIPNIIVSISNNTVGIPNIIVGISNNTVGIPNIIVGISNNTMSVSNTIVGISHNTVGISTVNIAGAWVINNPVRRVYNIAYTLLSRSIERYEPGRHHFGGPKSHPDILALLSKPHPNKRILEPIYNFIVPASSCRDRGGGEATPCYTVSPGWGNYSGKRCPCSTNLLTL